MTNHNKQALGFAQLASSIRPNYVCLSVVALSLFAFLLPMTADAVETVCARVKIEIKQELTLERQAFDAQMKINNNNNTTTTADGVISNVSVEVKVSDENGAPVSITTDPNNQNAKFFLRVSGKQGIVDITGTGSVAPQTAATINWLLIPAPRVGRQQPLRQEISGRCHLEVHLRRRRHRIGCLA